MSDLLDRRQRLAAALCLMAVDLPAPAAAWAAQIKQACQVCPNLTSAHMHDKRLDALLRARALIDEMIEEAAQSVNVVTQGAY